MPIFVLLEDSRREGTSGRFEPAAHSAKIDAVAQQCAVMID
jgi:hypothetical protein